MPVRTARPSIRTASLALCAVLAAGSCGGTRHVGEITPAVAGLVSGTWILDEAESDDPETALAAARPERGDAGPSGGRPQGGARPPGGGVPGGMGRPGGGGAPGGGARSGAGGMGAPRPGRSADPAAMQALRRMVTVPPRRLELSLTDSLVVVSPAREEPWALPFGEEVKRKLEGEMEVGAKADWEGGRLIVTRRVDGAGSLSETYMPSADGRRLTIILEFSPEGRGGIEIRRVYRSAGPEGTPSR